MNLPIPDSGEFAAGFASCAALMVAAVAARHVWPKVKTVLTGAENAVYAEYEAALQFFDAKLTGLSSTFAGAVNTIRGDVSGLEHDMAYLTDRIFTLEKAVGVSDPTADPPPAKAPPVQTAGTGIVAPAIPLHA